MDQAPIWNRAAVEYRPNLHRICSKLQLNCASMDAERFASIQNLPRLQQASKHQNFYQSDPFNSVVKSGMPLNQLLNPHRVNAQMHQRVTSCSGSPQRQRPCFLVSSHCVRGDELFRNLVLSLPFKERSNQVRAVRPGLKL